MPENKMYFNATERRRDISHHEVYLSTALTTCPLRLRSKETELNEKYFVEHDDLHFVYDTPRMT